MHPAEHRALRELFAAARQLSDHWGALAHRLELVSLAEGAGAAQELLSAVAAEAADRGLYGQPAAQGVGTTVAAARVEVGDRFLERNQALRLAVLDATFVVSLLAYLRHLALARGDAALAAFFSRWEKRMGAHERAAREAAATAGTDPDQAIERADASALGGLAHGVALAAGTVGEWLDRQRSRIL